VHDRVVLEHGSILPDATSVGARAYALARELFPICRSLTGPGVRQTLRILQRELPALTLHEVPSGTRCFDWTVPPEWSIREAYIATEDGHRIVDFANHNLHVVGYSTPIDAVMSLEELRPHLYSLPDQPDAIPYVTSYYRERWGFCLSQRQLDSLTSGRYRVKIDSTLATGSLTYGELLIPGERQDEIFLSTYVCHPSMGNNEVSGPVVTTKVARWLATLPARRFSYRIVFIPETIGSLVYLSRNLEVMKRRIVAGFNVTCVGDERAYSYLPSRQGDSLADRAALHVLRHQAGADGFVRYSYLDRGSDERQYCSPGVDLPVASIMRTKYGEYPEYHTSLDDLSLISPAGLSGGIVAIAKAILAIEMNGRYRATVLGEPQLGRRGLYPTLSTRGAGLMVRRLMDVLAYSDGKHDLLAIADLLGVPVWELSEVAKQLLAHELLADCDTEHRQEDLRA
jgi:aminopeptidase-like protein